MTLVAIIMRFNFNNGANVSRGHYFTIHGSIQFYKLLLLSFAAVIKQYKPNIHLKNYIYNISLEIMKRYCRYKFLTSNFSFFLY